MITRTFPARMKRLVRRQRYLSLERMLGTCALIVSGACAAAPLVGDVSVISGEGNPPSIVATGVIAAPPEKVWRILDDCNNYKKTLVSVAESNELSREGNKRRCRIVVDMPFPVPNLTSVTDSTNEIKPGKEWKRTWTLVEGDYKTNTGSWILTPRGAGNQQTLVVYRIQAEPKMAVPQYVVRMLQKRTIPALFEKLAESASGDAGRTD